MSTRRLVLALALAALLPAGPGPAPRPGTIPFADTGLPAGADPTFVRMVGTERPARHILRSIAIDLDRDGDLDVVAATLEEPVVVWIRDDAGRYRRQRPSRATRMAGERGVGSPAGSDVGVNEEAPPRWHHAADVGVAAEADNRPSLRIRHTTRFAPQDRTRLSEPSRGPPLRLVA